MSKGLDLIRRRQPEFINDFPTGNICIGVTEEELIELEKELKDKEKTDKLLEFIKKYVFVSKPFGSACYICLNDESEMISEEEYNLLKEMGL